MRTPRLSRWVVRKSSPFGCKNTTKKTWHENIRETNKVGPGKLQNMVTFWVSKTGEISRIFLFLIFDPSKIPSLTNSENGFTSNLQGGSQKWSYNSHLGGIGVVKFHPSETLYFTAISRGPMSLHFKLKEGPSL